MCLNWQSTLQHEDPWKLPNPGSHCSPVSTLVLPQTGGRVIEAVPVVEGVTVPVPVPVPVPVAETELVLEVDPDLVLEIDCVPVPEFVRLEVNEFELELELELLPEVDGVQELVTETVTVSVGSGELLGEAVLDGVTVPFCPLTRVRTSETTKMRAIERIVIIKIKGVWGKEGF